MTAPMADGNDIATEVIADQGDLFLIVGDKKKAKLRVSSAMLKGTSAVFAAMLGPHFQEGQGTCSAESPKEISFPDDDAIAMSDMCNLLHHKTPKELAGFPVSKTIVAVAVVIDKYACHEALRLQGQALLLGWLSHQGNLLKGLIPCSWCLMACAAYLFDHTASFRTFTNRLVTECFTPCSTLLKDKQCMILPLPVFQRQGAQRRISGALPVLGAPTCSLTSNPCRPFYDDAFARTITAAFKLDYWPPAFDENNSIAAAITTIKGIGDLSRKPTGCDHTLGHKTMVTAAEFIDLATSVEKGCEGLCLQCVKEGVLDLGTKCARKEHAS
ncbi:hypothetical protein LTR65_008224 [Meristemomyces frigidus]